MPLVYGRIEISFTDDGATEEKVDRLQNLLNKKWLEIEVAFDDLAKECGLDTDGEIHPIILDHLEIDL